MLKIKYRIVEDLNVLGKVNKASFDEDFNSIGGYFHFIAGEQRYGEFYHENPLKEGEVGMELLDLWLEMFLDMLLELNEKKYIAFQVPDMAYLWLELQRQENIVMINSYTDKNIQNEYTPIYRTKPVDGLVNNYSNAFQADYIEFSELVIKVTENFINELRELNIELMKTELVDGLMQRLENVKNN